MAFKELTEDIISLMTEEEKQRYYKQLNIHRQRVMLAEKLEQIDKADFKYKKPEFRKIKPVRRVDDIPQYKMPAKGNAVIPDNIFNGRNIAAENEKRSSVSQTITKRLNRKYGISNIPDLKHTTKPTTVSFKNAEKYKVSGLPENKGKIAQPTLKINSDRLNKCGGYKIKPVRENAADIKIPLTKKITVPDTVKINNIPAVTVKKAAVKEFIKPEFDTQKISDIKKISAEIKSAPAKPVYKAPEKAAVSVPTVAVKKAEELKKRSFPEVKVNVPKLNNITAAAINKYQPPKADISVKCPIVQDAPVSKAKPIDIPTVKKTDIPEVNIPRINENDFKKILERAVRGI